MANKALVQNFIFIGQSTPNNLMLGNMKLKMLVSTFIF